MHIAILGLGEAGSLYAAGFAAAGTRLTGYDPADSTTPPGVLRQATVADAVSEADLVLSLTGARHARSALEQAVPAMRAGACFADMNSGSPALKAELATLLGERGDLRFADVTVIGSVPEHGAATALVVSGDGAEDVRQAFAPLAAPVDVVSDRPGDAARRKLLRSMFMKSLGASVVEALAAGQAAGDLDWLRGQIAGALADGVPGMDRLADGTTKHGERRGHEARDAAAMAAELGITATMTLAAADVHLGAARQAGRLEDSLLAAYAGLASANIGDARQRLGLVDSGISAMWPGATVVGRAHTVFCRAGENVGLSQALETARPGDVLVVDGQGDVARALMGELIAERARSKGVRGMVIDGAVRDVSVLAEIGFPVWARAVTPAGPYKFGPGWAGRPVAVGGVVVNPGDLVVGDDDGVAIIPTAEAEQTLADARAIEADEAGRRAAIVAARTETSA
ncbi:NAD(P)-binding domain-containing protein [Promicromonospora sp. NPDC059942]|uniref:RraA family protein n=1 Tax=Promicromonospora sp. NPDC059942 TaxID=3347009 RepID=UPI00365363DA